MCVPLDGRDGCEALADVPDVFACVPVVADVVAVRCAYANRETIDLVLRNRLAIAIREEEEEERVELDLEGISTKVVDDLIRKEEESSIGIERASDKNENERTKAPVRSLSQHLTSLDVHDWKTTLESLRRMTIIEIEGGNQQLHQLTMPILRGFVGVVDAAAETTQFAADHVEQIAKQRFVSRIALIGDRRRHRCRAQIGALRRAYGGQRSFGTHRLHTHTHATCLSSEQACDHTCALASTARRVVGDFVRSCRRKIE